MVFKYVPFSPDPIAEESEKLLGSTEDSLKNTLWTQTFQSTDGYPREGRLAPVSGQPGNLIKRPRLPPWGRGQT